MGTSKQNIDWLYFATAGNVDDGKSTLLGRMLHDCGGLYEDELKAVRERSSLRNRALDPSIVFDGLKAELEKGITIDVAYRYFSTASKRFILMDCPGHAEYLGNFVTAVSRAAAVILIVDVTRPLATQTKRHLSLAYRLGTPHIFVCINKMDLVGYAQENYEMKCQEIRSAMGGLLGTGVAFVPISALEGDNIVSRSGRMPWYAGGPLLTSLQRLSYPVLLPSTGSRFLVQDSYENVVFGRVMAGEVSADETLVRAATGESVRVKGIGVGTKGIAVAERGLSVALELEGKTRVPRGEILSRPGDRPEISSRWNVTLFTVAPVRRDTELSAVFTTENRRGRLESFSSLEMPGFEPFSAAQELPAHSLASGCIGFGRPFAADTYGHNRFLGSFLLHDEGGAVKAIGLIEGAAKK